QPRRAWLGRIDAIAAEHQHVHLQAEAPELEQEMLAPATHGHHAATLHPGDVQAGVAADATHGLAAEMGGLLPEDDDGRPLRHDGAPAPRWCGPRAAPAA